MNRSFSGFLNYLHPHSSSYENPVDLAVSVLLLHRCKYVYEPVDEQVDEPLGFLDF